VSSDAAAANTSSAATAVGVDAIHLVAAGVWVGALGALVLLLRAARQADDADVVTYTGRAARRFSHAALVAMLVLIVSGVMNARAEIETIPALVGTPHGWLLLGKLALLVPILALAVVNRARILPEIAAPGAMRRLAAFVTLEVALAAAVLALAAAMTLTTPARHVEPVWPFPFRVAPELLSDVPATRWR